MANFDSPGAGLARGLRSGLAIGDSINQRKVEADEREKAEATAAIQKVEDAAEKARESAVNNVSMIAGYARDAAAKGALPEQIEKFRQAALASAMSYGQFLEEARATAANSKIDPSAIPSGRDFVDRQMALFDAGVQSASIEDTSGDFTTLTPEQKAAAGFAEDDPRVIQAGPDERLSPVSQPTRDPASAAADQFVTLPDEKAVALGFPTGTIVQEQSNGKLITSFSPGGEDSKTTFETLSPEEVVEQGFTPGSIVQRDSNGKLHITFGSKEPEGGGEFTLLSDEEVAEAGFPVGAVVERGPNKQVTLKFDPTEDESAIAERVALLTPFVGDEAAVGIATGRFAVSTNPITNESVVLDKATGDPVGDPIPAPPPEVVPPIVETDVDLGAALGGEGVFKNVVNVLTDAIGAGATFEDTQASTTALNTLQQKTKLSLQAAIPGRPATDIREDILKLTVTPNSLVTGPDRAKSKFQGVVQLVDSEITRMQNMLKTPLSPEDQGALKGNISELESLKAAYSQLIESFDVEEDVDAEMEADLDFFAPEEE